jgi:hypothetical protein
MTELPIDLDNILAYSIPGLIVLVGAAWLNPPWKHRFRKFHSDYSGSALVAIGVFTLAVGMLLGCVRSAILNPTCKLDLSWAYGSDAFAPISGDWEPINYAKIVDQGHLNAIREAKVNERTPYQVFGNTLAAAMVLVLMQVILLCRRATGREISRSDLAKGILVTILFLVLATALLYPSYRTKHYRYRQALEEINAA